ncbi:hypothetical protein [Tellurirhabdus rosea]|uniref:hypothetical protein n=1 Tax=Tellurirhabdus rosea TaxID=2674997 RepID=UPI002255E94E|nr:hypothetical protein [Tellurirhabdus rosea]
MKKRYIFLFFLLTPLWMWLGWWLLPKRTLVAAIVDKTVLEKSGQEHISLTWLLNHQRFTKTRTQPYRSSRDYFGFFPERDKKYSLKGLERFSDGELEQLSQDADLVYYTDTYGIYRNEWYSGEQQTERSGILYGGMSRKDVMFLKRMKARHKLILAEFNDINSPTNPGVRQEFEAAFGLRWTGWIGRYFDSLDTTVNEELPRWLVRNYRRQHNGQWPFTKSGVAFVSERDEVVVLENETHLQREVPYMVSSEFGQQYFDLPKRLPYSYWFDVLENNPAVNREVATHEVYANAAGQRELARHGIPSRFPAILMHKGADYEFYYFAGDFCDNPVSMLSSYFRGVELLGPVFYWAENLAQREGFFWRVYRPMTTKILEEYYDRTKKPTTRP